MNTYEVSCTKICHLSHDILLRRESECCAVNKILIFEGVAPIRISKGSRPFTRTVKRWVAEYKFVRISVEGDPREGSQKSPSIPQIID